MLHSSSIWYRCLLYCRGTAQQAAVCELLLRTWTLLPQPAAHPTSLCWQCSNWCSATRSAFNPVAPHLHQPLTLSQYECRAI